MAPIKVVTGKETLAFYLEAQMQPSHLVLSISQRKWVSWHESALRLSNVSNILFLPNLKSLHRGATVVKTGSLAFIIPNYPRANI